MVEQALVERLNQINSQLGDLVEALNLITSKLDKLMIMANTTEAIAFELNRKL